LTAVAETCDDDATGVIPEQKLLGGGGKVTGVHVA
jgi:hypothetical protein